jgi:hypothetical protein
MRFTISVPLALALVVQPALASEVWLCDNGKLIVGNGVLFHGEQNSAVRSTILLNDTTILISYTNFTNLNTPDTMYWVLDKINHRFINLSSLQKPGNCSPPAAS